MKKMAIENLLNEDIFTVQLLGREWWIKADFLFSTQRSKFVFERMLVI